MKSELKISGADDVLKMLKSLPSEVVSKRGGPVKSALRKGATVIWKQMIANLETVTGDDSSGLLKQSVKVTRGKPPTSGKGEIYLIRVLRKAYPNRSGKTVTTRKTASLLEYGSSKQPAEPWIVPAFTSKAQTAINVTVDDLKQSIDKIAQKFLKK